MKSLIYNFVAWSGIPQVFHRLAYRNTASILMYHSIVPENPFVPDWCLLQVDQFRRQIRYLKEHFHVIPLADILTYRCSSNKPPVAITFDDGFRNNFTIAYPILRELELPATIFIVTDLVDSEDTVWFCRVHEAVSTTRKKSYQIDGTRYNFESISQRQRANSDIQNWLKQFKPSELVHKMEEIIFALGDNPKKPIPLSSPYRILQRTEIREMIASGLIEIGAHTMSHTILSRLSEEERNKAIRGSIKAVRELTDRPCRLFAYPNGGPEDFGCFDESVLKDNNILASVTTIGGPYIEHSPPMRLKRYGIGSDMNFSLFLIKLHHLHWFIIK